jgi:NifU-like protein involved in Fe-S cluster formation
MGPQMVFLSSDFLQFHIGVHNSGITDIAHTGSGRKSSNAIDRGKAEV